jgi:hypothetical protein
MSIPIIKLKCQYTSKCYLKKKKKSFGLGTHESFCASIWKQKDKKYSWYKSHPLLTKLHIIIVNILYINIEKQITNLYYHNY